MSTRTPKSLVKRIKITAQGKIAHRRAGLSHNLTTKSRKRKRFLKRQALVTPALARKIRRLVSVT